MRSNWGKGGGVWGGWGFDYAVYVAHKLTHSDAHTYTHTPTLPLARTHSGTQALHKLSKLLFKSPPRGAEGVSEPWVRLWAALVQKLCTNCFNYALPQFAAHSGRGSGAVGVAVRSIS